MSLAKKLIVCACALTLLVAPSALAQTQGPFGLGTGDPVDPPHIRITPDNNEWHTGEPIPFFFDPDGGPIEKWLESPTPGWEPGINYTLHEEFEYFPAPDGSRIALTDWHEDFLPDPTTGPRAEWVGGTISTDWPNAGIDPKPVPGLEIMLEGPQIWFDFDPILPGTPNDPTVLHIWKEFRYVGGPNEAFQPILVLEHPTVPEPGALALAFLGAGILGMIGLRRKKG